jgi:hypothetical protein
MSFTIHLSPPKASYRKEFNHLYQGSDQGDAKPGETNHHYLINEKYTTGRLFTTFQKRYPTQALLWDCG